MAQESLAHIGRQEPLPGNLSDLCAFTLVLNRDNHFVRRDLANRDEMHRTMMRLLPDNLGSQPRHQANLLWSLDSHAAGGPIVVVQASSDLDIGQLPPGYVVQAVELPVRSVMESLCEGDRISYLVTANPVKRIRQDNGKSRRVALHSESAVDWWRTRHRSAGIQIDPYRLRYHELEPGVLRNKHRSKLCLSQFAGTATVEDIEKFQRRVIEGIGTGKSYGAGLILVAPHNSLADQG